MDIVEERYNRFIIFVKETIDLIEKGRSETRAREKIKMKKSEYDARKKLLNEKISELERGCIEFLALIKVSRKELNLLQIEDKISTDLSIKKDEISHETYIKLRRYLEYFDEIASTYA